jgi:hypothetical protein
VARRDNSNVATIDDDAQQLVADKTIAESPKLLLALGRGKTGKSTWIRWAAERSLGRGGTPVIADADRTNASLSVFFENVIRPPSPEDDDVRLWLNGFANRQIEEKFSAFLDLGGGDLVLKSWARDLELAPFLESYGITPIALHFLGPDLDDLTYLRDIETVAKFQPKHVGVVLNEGVIPPGRVARTAFEPVINHEVFREVLARGARVMRMPRLSCAHEVENRGLSFSDAEASRVKPGQANVDPISRRLIGLWRRDMEASFAEVAEWIP